jgi:hypothetical protein
VPVALLHALGPAAAGFKWFGKAAWRPTASGPTPCRVQGVCFKPGAAESHLVCISGRVRSV